MAHGLIARSLAVLSFSLAACTSIQADTAKPAIISRAVELSSGDSGILNYTPWYIHTWELEGPAGSGIRGGGRNALPIHEDGRPYGGSGMCCTSYPVDWQPNLRLTVRWLVYKDVKRLGAKAPGYWYKADNVRIAQYNSRQTGGVWAIFLPGDRVRFMIVDGNHDGGNNPNNRPADNDPYIAQGVLDDEWNRLYPDGVAQGVAR